jgi:transposase
VLRLLVASRLMWPGSKRAAVAKAGRMRDAPTPSLPTVYKALDPIARLALPIQTRARRAVAGGERLSCVFYDVTNYFFEIDQADPAGQGHDPPRGAAARRVGASKQGRASPIIQMGLFMDPDGLPVSYRLFDGSSPDCVTLRGALKEFKAAFGATKVTVVADAAMSNGPNLAALQADGDDWVFASSIRKEPKELRAWVLDPAGWTHLAGADGTVHARVKSKTITRKIRHKTDDGKTRLTQVEEKVVAKWSADYAARDRLNRAEMAAKAQALAADPAKFKASNRRGVKKYVAAVHADPATGEVLEGVEVLSLDTARLQADALLDGYWTLHSSRVAASEAELLADYRQLWMIEDTFRVSKTDLEARPVYVWTPEHIEAHFATCFVALLTARIMERRTGLPAHRLQDAMRRFSVSRAAPGVHLVNRPPEWDAIDEALGVDTNRKWVNEPGLRQWRRQIAAGFTQLLPT